MQRTQPRIRIVAASGELLFQMPVWRILFTPPSVYGITRTMLLHANRKMRLEVVADDQQSGSVVDQDERQQQMQELLLGQLAAHSRLLIPMESVRIYHQVKPGLLNQFFREHVREYLHAAVLQCPNLARFRMLPDSDTMMRDGQHARIRVTPYDIELVRSECMNPEYWYWSGPDMMISVPVYPTAYGDGSAWISPAIMPEGIRNVYCNRYEIHISDRPPEACIACDEPSHGLVVYRYSEFRLPVTPAPISPGELVALVTYCTHRYIHADKPRGDLALKHLIWMLHPRVYTLALGRRHHITLMELCELVLYGRLLALRIDEHLKLPVDMRKRGSTIRAVAPFLSMEQLHTIALAFEMALEGAGYRETVALVEQVQLAYRTTGERHLQIHNG